MQFHVGVPAVAGLDTVSAILCAACLVHAHLKLQLLPVPALGFVRALEHEQHLLFRLLFLLLSFNCFC